MTSTVNALADESVNAVFIAAAIEQVVCVCVCVCVCVRACVSACVRACVWFMVSLFNAPLSYQLPVLCLTCLCERN